MRAAATRLLELKGLTGEHDVKERGMTALHASTFILKHSCSFFPPFSFLKTRGTEVKKQPASTIIRVYTHSSAVERSGRYED
jgi:hypothetical protein